MKRIGFTSVAWSAVLTVVLVGAAFATPLINDASIETRTFNDCPLSTLTTSNNYPASVEITDEMSGLCVGFANLHTFSLSGDGGATAAVFNNNSSFKLAADVTISGAGEGEGGLRISPWWSQYVDGRFMINATTGEIACFGGRLPFYTFTGAYGIHYVKGSTVHMEVTYLSNGLSSTDPATIQYRLVMGGTTYDSPVINFDMANPAEDPPHGLWGMLNDGRAGGYFQPRANTGAALTANWSNIQYTILGTPNPNAATIETRTFNDCPLSTLTTTNNYPSLVSISDEMSGLCVGFANLHSWTFSEDGGATQAVFNNTSKFRFGADVTIDGAGEGEGGLRFAPWWAKNVDGRFMLNATTGEIACFGGRLPFYTFTGAYGIHYVKGTTVHMAMTYRPNGLSSADPATIQYSLTMGGTTYSSPLLPYDMANPAEDPPYGLWGCLNDARAGGYFQPRANTGATLTCSWANITYSLCTTDLDFTFDPQTINLNSHGKWVTAYIEPADGINISSLRLNGTVAVDPDAPTSVGDVDGDGIPDLMVKFPRADAVATLSAGNAIEITLAGDVGSDCFTSSDVIKAKSKTLDSPLAGSIQAPSSQANIDWSKDVDDPSTVDIIASFDDGESWSVVAQNLNNNGHYRWNVPAIYSTNARVAVVKLGTPDAGGLVTTGEYGESGAFAISSPTGVGDNDVAFAIRGVQPNPARGPFSVTFSLPNNKPARLAVYDVTGREVASREVGGLGAGRHVMAFGAREKLRAGVYMVKLTQQSQSLKTRVVVIE